MGIEAEFIGTIYSIAFIVIAVIAIVCHCRKQRKANEWRKIYGNTDFTNPYQY